MNVHNDDGLVWLGARRPSRGAFRDDSPALRRSRWVQRMATAEPGRRLTAATAADLSLVLIGDDSGDPGYVGRHHIPGDGVTTLRLMDVDGSGDVVGVRYVEDYHVTGEVSAA